MTDAVTTLRVFTGSGAATESAAQTGIDLISADNAVNSSGNRAAHEVAPGANAFEKYLKVKLDTANGHSLSNFWIERTGDLPDGVILKFGVSDTGATPTASMSTIATTTMVEGRRYIWDVGSYDTNNDTTRFLVIQEQVALTAASGAIPTDTIQIGWSQS